MCEWGNDTILDVLIPAHLSHDGQERWDKKGIDSCIAPLIEALNMAKIYTSQCCCGHDKAPGWISLHDGRELMIFDRDYNYSHEDALASMEDLLSLMDRDAERKH